LFSDKCRRLIFHKELSQEIAFKKPAFACHFAGVLKHVRGNRQMMDRAIARVRELQDQKFIEA
jgi:hypothetical protein